MEDNCVHPLTSLLAVFARALVCFLGLPAVFLSGRGGGGALVLHLLSSRISISLSLFVAAAVQTLTRGLFFLLSHSLSPSRTRFVHLPRVFIVARGGARGFSKAIDSR